MADRQSERILGAVMADELPFYRIVGREALSALAAPAVGTIVAIHLATGEHHLAGDFPRSWWKQHGKDGLGDVVCVDCHAVGHPEPWVHYREGDFRQAHLSHFASKDGTQAEVRHSGETVWHLAAKRSIAEWARIQLGVELVGLEVAVDCGRRPDVLVRIRGALVAFELQYSPIAPEQWRARQMDLARADITTTWLFARGNAPHLERGYGMDATNCFVFDLDEREVGLLVKSAESRSGTWHRSDDDLIRYVDHWAMNGDAWDHARFVRLGQCGITRAGIRLPVGLMPSDDTALIEKERAQRRRAEEASRQVEPVKVQPAARGRVEIQPRRDRWSQIERANQERWAASELHAFVEKRWGDKVPGIIGQRTRDTWGIHAEPVHWHAALYVALMHHKAGRVFTIDMCWRVLDRHGIARNWDRKKAFRSLIVWLEEAQRWGLVRRLSADGSPTYSFRVLSDLDDARLAG